MQPNWKCIAQLGDAHPIEYGGYWIMEDTTGVYPPEGELLETGDEGEPLTVYRFILEPCTYLDGVLSDNRFHPGHPAWFADSLGQIASANGIETEALIALFTSHDARERAVAWRMVGEYHGLENLDSYPFTLTEGEARQRFNGEQYRIAP